MATSGQEQVVLNLTNIPNNKVVIFLHSSSLDIKIRVRKSLTVLKLMQVFGLMINCEEDSLIFWHNEKILPRHWTVEECGFETNDVIFVYKLGEQSGGTQLTLVLYG